MISQEVEKIIPELVKESKSLIREESDSKNISEEEETYKTISYPKVIPILVESTKEQQPNRRFKERNQGT